MTYWSISLQKLFHLFSASSSLKNLPCLFAHSIKPWRYSFVNKIFSSPFLPLANFFLSLHKYFSNESSAWIISIPFLYICLELMSFRNSSPFKVNSDLCVVNPVAQPALTCEGQMHTWAHLPMELLSSLGSEAATFPCFSLCVFFLSLTSK